MKVQGLRTVPFKIVGEAEVGTFWVETSLSLLLTFFGPPPPIFYIEST